ncbi:Na(+)-translocating NADH-quinone reductase subunit C [Marinibactrum halimedae]|uniref:Na(+)-translocating NADH-quinone reductase subunit C n=1 Tax=Marinibactrum halimedae TaxID=1444977 RepID=A0AA37TFG2_9GAMM|nr:Na(+)-translocating NADH-quinone reductase subunit C [Marinibactrum halimedae]MCD9459483.1 Na(+)-translocating NADH-quinone reductase subunit C [Marinibactrum halimedae]GLS28137.1 Na(+)-translocating NADH-quinone reductase subunit C [Marinibactrum halimedae]
MSNKESTLSTVTVALVLCIVCSVVVSTAAVVLKPAQVANKEKDFKRNILAAAGMLEEGVSIEKQFERVETRLVDLSTGKFTDQYDPDSYDQRKVSKDPKFSSALSKEQDIAKIGRRVDVAEIYLINNGSGLDKVILPVKGYGLWSTLYGFLALESDLNTVAGLGFYEHGETPGLGGEVDNPKWKGLWIGKEIYSAGGDVEISVIKGTAPADSKHQIDGLSGATLTSKGVHNLVQFWMGQEGYGSFLNNLKQGEA